MARNRSTPRPSPSAAAIRGTSKRRANPPAPATLNVVVLRGVCSGPPEIRELPSGERRISFAVRTTMPSGLVTSVPVVWWNPPAWVSALDADEDVVVVGCVRRRFFRRHGGLASSVEVEATVVSRATARARDAAWHRADAALEPLRAR
jgi:hypothetical protein